MVLVTSIGVEVLRNTLSFCFYIFEECFDVVLENIEVFVKFSLSS